MDDNDDIFGGERYEALWKSVFGKEPRIERAEELLELYSALSNNSKCGLRFGLVKDIVLVLEGDNDAENWHWIVSLRDGRYAYVCGWCDYTGWDCQSGVEAFIEPTLEAALAQAPLDVRNDFEQLLLTKEFSMPSHHSGW